MRRFFAAIWRRIGIRGLVLGLVLFICLAIVGFNQFMSMMIAQYFATQQMPSVSISATEVKPVTWTPQIDAIGTLWASEGVDVAAQVAGVVRSIAFSANERIEKDALLVQIDDAVERADLLSARAAVDRDRAQLERAESLRQSGVSSVATLEEAETAFAVSESALARIEAVLDQKAINAPFAGIIGIPRIDVGEYLQVGAVIATLQQLDTMRVDFTVPEQQVQSLNMDQAASFGLTEGEFPFEGRIVGIDPKIDPQTRMVSVRAEVDNPGGELLPGQFVRVRVALPAMEDVIALPQTAVVTSLYGDYVYVVEEAPPAPAPAGGAEVPAAPEGAAPPAEGEAAPAAGAQAQAEQSPAGESAGNGAADEPAAASGPPLVARQVFVEIGRRQGALIEIAKGLEAGQTVVTSGQNKLTNNAPVTINNAVDPAAIALDGGAGAP